MTRPELLALVCAGLEAEQVPVTPANIIGWLADMVLALEPQVGKGFGRRPPTVPTAIKPQRQDRVG